MRAGDRELRTNAISATLWNNALLVLALVSLPLTARLLSPVEFALWTQLVAIASIVSLADLGVGQVLLRQLAVPQEPAHRRDQLRSGIRFFMRAGAVIAVILTGVTFAPGGLLGAYSGAEHPRAAAGLFIVAAVSNFVSRPFGVSLLAKGRLNRERLFGALPAILGTILGLVTIAKFHSALSMVIAYSATEVAINLVLVATTRSDWAPSYDVRGGPTPIKGLFPEAGKVAIVEFLPDAALAADMAIIASVGAPAAAAAYAISFRVADLLRRLVSPYLDTFLIAQCRRDELGDRGHGLASRVMSAILLMAVLGSFLAGSLGIWLLNVLFGDDYVFSTTLLVSLLIAVALRSTSGFLVKATMARNRLCWTPVATVSGLLARYGVVAIVLMNSSNAGVLNIFAGAVALAAVIESVGAIVDGRFSAPRLSHQQRLICGALFVVWVVFVPLRYTPTVPVSAGVSLFGLGTALLLMVRRGHER